MCWWLLSIAIRNRMRSHDHVWTRVDDLLMSTHFYPTTQVHFTLSARSFFCTSLFSLRHFSTLPASNSPFSIDESCSSNLSRSELWFPVLLSIFFIIFRVVYATELLVIDFLIKILCYILLSDRFKTLFKYYLCHHSLFTVQLPIIFSLYLFPQYCSGAINLFLGETATKFSKLE